MGAQTAAARAAPGARAPGLPAGSGPPTPPPRSLEVGQPQRWRRPRRLCRPWSPRSIVHFALCAPHHVPAHTVACPGAESLSPWQAYTCALPQARRAGPVSSPQLPTAAWSLPLPFRAFVDLSLQRSPLTCRSRTAAWACLALAPAPGTVTSLEQLACVGKEHLARSCEPCPRGFLGAPDLEPLQEGPPPRVLARLLLCL